MGSGNVSFLRAAIREGGKIMHIDITSKGHDLSENLEEKVIVKLNKLEKYIHGNSEADVLMERNHLGQIVEIKLHANRHRFHVRETTDNVLQCIDKAIHKLEAQLRKVKDKMTDWKPDKPKEEEIGI